MKFLAKEQGGATHPSLIIIRFPAAQVPDTATLTKLLRPFPGPEQALEFRKANAGAAADFPLFLPPGVSFPSMVTSSPQAVSIKHALEEVRRRSGFAGKAEHVKSLALTLNLK